MKITGLVNEQLISLAQLDYCCLAQVNDYNKLIGFSHFLLVNFDPTKSLIKAD